MTRLSPSRLPPFNRRLRPIWAALRSPVPVLAPWPVRRRHAVLSGNWAGHESEGFRNGSAPLARERPATIVPGRETSEAGRPLPISGLSDGRLDPSEAAAGHRVPAGREPGAPRTPRHGAPAVHGRRAPAPGREGSGARPDHAGRGGDPR